MLIVESHVDVQTTANGKDSTMSIYPITTWYNTKLANSVYRDIPLPSNHSRIPQSVNSAPNYTNKDDFYLPILRKKYSRFPGVCLFSEIYQGKFNPDNISQAYGSTVLHTFYCSNWPCCKICSSDCWSRLYCRSTIIIPWLCWAWASQIRRSRYRQGESIQNWKGIPQLIVEFSSQYVVNNYV